jgi:hypothetical protein
MKEIISFTFCRRSAFALFCPFMTRSSKFRFSHNNFVGVHTYIYITSKSFFFSGRPIISECLNHDVPNNEAVCSLLLLCYSFVQLF